MIKGQITWKQIYPPSHVGMRIFGRHSYRTVFPTNDGENPCILMAFSLEEASTLSLIISCQDLEIGIGDRIIDPNGNNLRAYLVADNLCLAGYRGYFWCGFSIGMLMKNPRRLLARIEDRIRRSEIHGCIICGQRRSSRAFDCIEDRHKMAKTFFKKEKKWTWNLDQSINIHDAIHRSDSIRLLSIDATN